MTSAILAYLFALAGCRTVGFGGPVRILVQGIATIARNIPNIAWAFILMFSFEQSEFTGFLVLFMKSFGFLTRMFLETMDEAPQGSVSALLAVGATRLQIIRWAIWPDAWQRSGFSMLRNGIAPAVKGFTHLCNGDGTLASLTPEYIAAHTH